MTIDAHQHFWKYDAHQHSWINDEMAVIRKDFFPEDLEPVLEENRIAGCVAVQADESDEETIFLTGLAADNKFIKAVVGWVNLMSENIEEALAIYSEKEIIKGFRQILQSRDPSFMLQPAFLRGISLLQAHNFTYDILIYPHHLPAAIELVKKNPNQLFVVDHLAKPYIKKGLIDDWKKDIGDLAAFDNVFCKISGMVTEADFKTWKQEDFTPYMDVVVNAFGTKRIMFGSDWPVCLVAASYKKVITIVKDYFKSFSVTDNEAVFGGNATRFYKIES